MELTNLKNLQIFTEFTNLQIFKISITKIEIYVYKLHRMCPAEQYWPRDLFSSSHNTLKGFAVLNTTFLLPGSDVPGDDPLWSDNIKALLESRGDVKPP